MKKTLAILTLTAILGGFIIPALVSAQAPEECTVRKSLSRVGLSACDTCPNNVCKFEETYGSGADAVSGATCCLFNTILVATDWMFLIIMVVVVIFIVFGAFTLLTSGGSEEGVKKGRNYIIFALVGLAVALFSRALPFLVKSIMGF